MTPAARAQAAITILDQILAGDAAEAALLRWARGSRFAGSGDRAAVRDLVFDSLRCKRSRAALGGAMSGRGLMIGMLIEEARDPASIFTGDGHAPAPLTPEDREGMRAPCGIEGLDLPDWIWSRWRSSLGESAERVAMAMRDRAPVWLRVNKLRATAVQAQAALSDDGIMVEPFAALPSALMVTQGGRRVSGSRAYQEGMVELQDLSPQLACAALPEVRSALDYCAGGGGKALAMASGGIRNVTAHDIDAGRMSDLASRARRAGAAIKVSAPGKVSGRFDLVLTDVPCSGSGTWRRTPDAKWRLDEAGLERLLEIQAAILLEAAQFVAPLGYLAYMTCSLLDDENGSQVARFLSRGGFQLESERRYSPLDASDGFYFALMRRC